MSFTLSPFHPCYVTYLLCRPVNNMTASGPQAFWAALFDTTCRIFFNFVNVALDSVIVSVCVCLYFLGEVNGFWTGFHALDSKICFA